MPKPSNPKQIELDVEYSPHKNSKAISIIQQADGNWIGEMFKFKKVVRVRQGDPQIVLQMLLTHSGKD